MTFGESFFDMQIVFNEMWPPRDKAPEIPDRHMINSKKVILTIAGNPSGFHLIEILSKGQKFYADYHCSYVHTRLSKICR
jgi:hypothetical protein